jgi:PhzF family phenazine biosynthesis protein
MKIALYQADAFTANLFEGNPAAVCPLDEWLPDTILQNIALENNLSETAFFVKEEGGYRLRWFTPTTEVDLCGHATLASAHILFNEMGYSKPEIVFSSNSGPLKVRQRENLLVMDFPVTIGEKVVPTDPLRSALGIDSGEVLRATDYMVVLKNKQEVLDLVPDFTLLEKVKTRGVIVTAPDREYDFVSRFFAPAVGIKEDPVTGSAHTMLAPYWAEQLGKKELQARQVSKRGGTVFCRYLGERVEIAGEAVTYLNGTIEI